MTYRHMRKVHALGCKHSAMANNPPILCTAPPGPGAYAYRTALCGQTTYCREMPGRPGEYADQFDAVPFVSWRLRSHMVTCKSCQKVMRK